MAGQFRGRVTIVRYGNTVEKPFIELSRFNQLSVQNGLFRNTVYPLDEAELITHNVSSGEAAIKVA